MAENIIMITTVKDIKRHAFSLKHYGLKGKEAWKRLDGYLNGFHNVDFDDGHATIRTEMGTYKSIYDIIKPDYFF